MNAYDNDLLKHYLKLMPARFERKSLIRNVFIFLINETFFIFIMQMCKKNNELEMLDLEFLFWSSGLIICMFKFKSRVPLM